MPGPGWTPAEVTNFWSTIGASVVACLAIIAGVVVAQIERRHRERGQFRDVRRNVYVDFLRSVDRVRVSGRARGRALTEPLSELQAASTALFLVAPSRVRAPARRLWPAIQAWHAAPRGSRLQAAKVIDDRLKDLRAAMTEDITPKSLRRDMNKTEKAALGGRLSPNQTSFAVRQGPTAHIAKADDPGAEAGSAAPR